MTHKRLSMIAAAVVAILVAMTALDAQRAVGRVQTNLATLEDDDASAKDREMALLTKTYAQTERITADVARVNATLDSLTGRLQTLEKRVDK